MTKSNGVGRGHGGGGGYAAWPSAATALLEQLTAAGQSALQISCRLVQRGFAYSRNAVIGKRHRLRLGSKYQPPPRKHPPRKRGGRRGRPPKPKPEPVPAAAPVPLNIPTLQLQPQHCRFPTQVWPHCFCGAQARIGEYCIWHYHHMHRSRDEAPVQQARGVVARL